jgi:CHAT domain-containing protein
VATEDDPQSLARDGTSRSFVALANGERLSSNTLESIGYKGSRLVVLSACLTGRGWIAESGSVGLPRLFHLRGADEVVMSLWQVDDKATRALMSAVMNEYLKAWPKASAATALRKASLAFRQDPEYRRPAFWAAFSVFGVGPFN